MSNKPEVSPVGEAIGTPVAEANVLSEMEQLKAIIAEATAKMKGMKDAEAKALEAIDGKRIETATKIHQAVKALNLDSELTAVLAKGFVYKLDETIDGAMVTYVSVELTGKGRTKRSGGSGASPVTSEAKFGMKLDEIFTKFANDDEKALYATAGLVANPSTKRSKQWKVKDNVSKRALSEGLITVKA